MKASPRLGHGQSDLTVRSLEEVARILGITKQAVLYHEKRAIAKLRKRLEQVDKEYRPG